MPKNISNKITEIAKDNQFTIVGDGGHSSRALHDYIYGPETMSALKEGGVKHVFIEMPQELQYYADELVSGEITRDEFVEDMSHRFVPLYMDSKHHAESIADTVVYAKENGMKVHFVDPGIKDPPEYSEAVQNSMVSTMGKVLEKAGIEPAGNYSQDGLTIAQRPELKSEFLQEYNAYLQTLPPDQKAVIDADMEEFGVAYDAWYERRTDDVDLHENITSVAGNEKSGIIYGAGHEQLPNLLTQSGHSHGNVDIFESREKAEKDTDNLYENRAYLNTDTVEAAPQKPEQTSAPAPKQLTPAM